MKHLILLRHAKSSRDNLSLPDHDRPLSARGKRDAKLLGRISIEKNISPDYILCSTSLRTKETLKHIQQLTHRKKDIINYQTNIYEISLQSLYTLVQSLDDSYKSVMIIGHNPSIEEFATYIWSDIRQVTTGGMFECSFDTQKRSTISPENISSSRYISPKIIREYL